MRIIEGEGTLPAAFYQTDLSIGATSQPQLLDIARLAPGTMVVDDSFPAYFDVEQALAQKWGLKPRLYTCVTVVLKKQDCVA